MSWRCIEPRGMQIASNVMNQHDGSLRVEFVPVTVGKHWHRIPHHFSAQ